MSEAEAPKAETPTDQSTPKAPKAEALSNDANARQEIERIKAENLSGQQLRLARRLAIKHALEPTSDLDAVRLLRKQGLDPFAAPEIDKSPPAQEGTQRPKNLPAKRKRAEVGAPGTLHPINDAARAKAILKIQRDLVRRRRRRIIQLVARLSFFVWLPTIIAGYYFYAVATPMYSVKSEFSVESAENPATPVSSGLFGGSGSSLLNPSESVGVQNFLSSIEAMLMLDEELDFRAAFQSEDIDAIQRMDQDASNETAFKTYADKVLVGFDQTEGIIRMEVIAPTPDQAMGFSQALLGYAEDRVGNQTERLRNDQEAAARRLYDEAEANLNRAQGKVLDLQEKRGVLSAELEIGALMTQITNLETILLSRKLSLAELNNNTRPNQAKVNALNNQINELEKSIGELREGMTAGSAQNSSLARITSELQQAEAEVLLRQTLLAQSVTTLETASIEASRQTKYLARNVNPVRPEDPAYPKKFENTLLSFLVFAGLYLMISLTGSILREQVSN
ncbi:capsule polysaccharide transporter [Amylibacter marinus]|uniref:Capsule polysaccharide transporter n=1 Tax=Amylibacter marinus TaxID=1475483 RepID=A0ABQ5VYJ2_9RHOB|nr:capsule biosynthesis protein [Amylibacter marinus]GLQ36272.1 capsule polysaccharide transporter [Amylibacter marinus]